METIRHSKLLICLLMFFLLIVSIPLACMAEERLQDNVDLELGEKGNYQEFKGSIFLPLGLKTIGEGAFEGTGIAEVIIPKSVTVIENRAFANNPELSIVQVAETEISFGKDIFAGSKNVAIAGSYQGRAKRWAREQGLVFVLVSTWNAKKDFAPGAVLIGSILRSVPVFESGRQICESKKNEIQTGRSLDEIKADGARSIAGIYIQSRYFP